MGGITSRGIYLRVLYGRNVRKVNVCFSVSSNKSAKKRWNVRKVAYPKYTFEDTLALEIQRCAIRTAKRCPSVSRPNDHLMLMEDDLSDSSESFRFEDEDSDVTIAQVLSFIVASHNMNAQACALSLELRDLDDDYLPDILEGDFSVNKRLPAVNHLERIASGPESMFYN